MASAALVKKEARGLSFVDHRTDRYVDRTGDLFRIIDDSFTKTFLALKDLPFEVQGLK
jgi:hypothetical protein